MKKIISIIYWVGCSYTGFAHNNPLTAPVINHNFIYYRHPTAAKNKVSDADFTVQVHDSIYYRKRTNSTDTSRGSVTKPGSMTPEQALKYVKAHPNAKLHHSNSNIDTTKISDFSPIIDSTDGNSKYDAGYVAGSGESLKEYRKRNKEAVIQGNVELIAKVIFVIVFLTGLVFLIRLILRNWAVIRKFFLG